jgi:hypothetical protein
MTRNGLQVTDEADRIMTVQEEQGETAILCAINGKIFSPILQVIVQGSGDRWSSG